MNITKSISAIEISGRFDAHEATSFRETIEQELTTSSNIRLSLAEVEFVDSTALAELVRAMKKCREQGGDLILSEVSGPVAVILELTKLDAAFTIE